MKTFQKFILLVCALLAGYSTSTGQMPHREVAFTIDDLPMAGDTDDLKIIQDVNARMLASLVASRVPATGFVIESRLLVKGETDARISILQKWLDAGMTLGNHTYSHADFNQLTLQQYEDEVIRAEAVTRLLMQKQGNKRLYFRPPFNHTGTTKEAKESFEAFLNSRGYEIAPFTIEHEDYLFSDVYKKASLRKDEALTRRIRAAYLDYLDTMFEYYERRSRLLLGYEAKQVFLIHVNELNADTLDEMIARLRQRGYSFITLEEALQDKAYRIKDEYVGKYGISWMHRWMPSLGKKLDYRDEPDPPKFVVDLYEGK